MSRNNENVVSQLSRQIWILALVSFFMNSASVVITAMTPYYITIILGGSTSTIGWIRGISETVAFVVKLFSGLLSDYIGKRKIIVVAGYAVAFITKPLFAITQGVWMYFSIQMLERIANGLRDTPRDALIADYATKGEKGKAFGVRNACAYAGSLLGSVACFLLLSNMNHDSSTNIRMVYLFAAIPAGIAVLLLIFGIQEPKLTALKKQGGFPIKREYIVKLDSNFWKLMVVVFLFMCSRFSETFLIHRLLNAGVQNIYASLVLALMYMFNVPVAHFVGSLSDNIPRKYFLGFGFVMLTMSSTLLIYTGPETISYGLIAIICYGIHHGSTQGTMMAMVADYAPAKLKGTSFGVFNLVCAVGILISNLLTGYVWDIYGPNIAFGLMTCFSTLAMISLLFINSYTQPMS